MATEKICSACSIGITIHIKNAFSLERGEKCKCVLHPSRAIMQFLCEFWFLCCMRMQICLFNGTRYHGHTWNPPFWIFMRSHDDISCPIWQTLATLEHAKSLGKIRPARLRPPFRSRMCLTQTGVTSLACSLALRWSLQIDFDGSTSLLGGTILPFLQLFRVHTYTFATRILSEFPGPLTNTIKTEGISIFSVQGEMKNRHVGPIASKVIL